MRGEIIAIGDELTSGRILNSTSNFAARHLFAAGHDIVAMHTIPDASLTIGGTLNLALERADFVVVTGGLGATTDDLTNEAVANALDLPITFHPEILEKINACNAKKSEVCVPLEKLAWLPEGAEVLKPKANMAGHMLIHREKPIFFLPGVPHEMKELLADVVIPRLAAMEDSSAFIVRHKLYKVQGIPETAVNEALKETETQDARVRIGYYPVFPEVHLSLTIRDKSSELVEQLFTQHDTAILAALEEHIFAVDGETMEGVVGKLLLQQNKTLATAESCTGGLISHAITKVSGSSEYFMGGVVAYSNDLKEELLDVSGKSLEQFGAVSPQVAREMAQGIRRRTGADIGISVTGIAGPTGGSPEKPLGTVYFGLASAESIEDFLFHFKGDRWKVQHHSSHMALDLVRKHLSAK